MAETYSVAIAENMKWHPLKIVLDPPRWLVIAPEMGSGKTYGACLYLGMMARAAKTVPAPFQLGGLFVCRTIKQCEEAVELINGHAGYTAAITRHSGNEVSVEATVGFPILVITHAALTNPNDSVRNELLSQYSQWRGGRRCLTIIDEALANVVKVHSVTEQSLLDVLAQIPPSLREEHVRTWDIVNFVLDSVVGRSGSQSDMSSLWKWKSTKDLEGATKMRGWFGDLTRDLKRLKRTETNNLWNDRRTRDADVARVEATLDAVAGLFEHWALFVKKGAEAGAVSARLLLPKLWCPVILNATAHQDVFLDSIGATIVQMPKVRNYQNLTIKVLRSGGIGKEAMKARAIERLRRLGDFINKESVEGDEWLVVTHKDTEGIARLHLPDKLGVTAHWGALDGLNEFNNCNKAVLFGLSYRDPTWSSALYFALHGVQSDEWFKSDHAKKIKHQYETKAIAANIIQALGRPRSRKVFDDMGNCLATTVYITLPNNALGRSIEQHIRDEFPGVVIEAWEYQMDYPTDDTAKPLNVAAAVVKHMQNQPLGRFAVNEIANDLGFSVGQKSALKDGLKKKRKVFDDLAAIGVAYVVEGKSRGAKSYLVKNG
ncbi:MAG: hypothetical protein Q8L53_06660 [Aestuariivirga sp.]|nr:hypothetical protein [Aestuariivirga sp.]